MPASSTGSSTTACCRFPSRCRPSTATSTGTPMPKPTLPTPGCASSCARRSAASPRLRAGPVARGRGQTPRHAAASGPHRPSEGSDPVQPTAPLDRGGAIGDSAAKSPGAAGEDGADMQRTTNARAMTGGMAIVEALIANSVDTVFGLPGAQLYPLFDALEQRADRIRTFGARHEQACGYMAFGYARSTGRPGVFAVVPGPGILNTSAALATALGCCAPVLCITGQVPAAFLGRGRGHLHELPDQLATLRTLTKWAARIERPADAPEAINEAFRQMLSGRPGPVAVEMAWDTMAASGHVEPLGPAAIPPPVPPSPLEVEAAAEILCRARRAMIMTGSGAQHAGEAVLALAEELDAPVAAFRGGRGVVAEDHPLGVSSYAAFKLWPETDALVAIGTRAEMAYMRWTGMMSLIDRPQAPPHLIRIDIDPAEMRRLVPHAGIVADADAGTRALLAAVRRLRQAGRGSK